MSNSTTKRSRLKGRMEGGHFVPFPLAVLNAPKFIGLSANAKRLLFDMAAGFKFGHNGDVSVARSLMKKRRWKSHAGLSKALNELLAAGLVEQTRVGGLHQCALFGFSWLAVDECDGKLDVASTKVPSGLWRGTSAPPRSFAQPLHKATEAHAEGRFGPSVRHSVGSKGPAIGPTVLIAQTTEAQDAGPSKISPCGVLLKYGRVRRMAIRRRRRGIGRARPGGEGANQ